MFPFFSADLEPEFADRIGNKTAVIGENVELTCVVENLGSYRVSEFFSFFFSTNSFSLLNILNKCVIKCFH